MALAACNDDDDDETMVTLTLLRVDLLTLVTKVCCIAFMFLTLLFLLLYILMDAHRVRRLDSTAVHVV